MLLFHTLFYARFFINCVEFSAAWNTVVKEANFCVWLSVASTVNKQLKMITGRERLIRNST